MKIKMFMFQILTVLSITAITNIVRQSDDILFMIVNSLVVALWAGMLYDLLERKEPDKKCMMNTHRD